MWEQNDAEQCSCGVGVDLYIHANIQEGFGLYQHGPGWVTLTGAGVTLIMGGIARLLGPIVLSVSTQGPLGGGWHVELSRSLSC